MCMKLRKILVAILIIVIILTLEASYLFTGSPRVQPVETTTEQSPSSFVGPTGAPSVRGPQTETRQ